MTIKIAVIQFPGANCDLDAVHVLRNVVGVDTSLVWHNDFKEADFDGVILPGGFSFGDYLRAGIIAAHSPALDEARIMLKDGRPILGICNGFQILIEAEFLPGALLQNESLKFVCKWVNIKVLNDRTAFTHKMKKDDVLAIPIAHGEGRYYTVFKYSTEDGSFKSEANPTGTLENIAGICNIEQNCVGLMPHPERASESILSPKQTTHGRIFFESMIDFIKRRLT